VTKEDLQSLYLHEVHQFLDTSNDQLLKPHTNTPPTSTPEDGGTVSFSLQDFFQFLHYELRTHRNEEKFLQLLKELGDYVVKNYAPKPVVTEEDEECWKSYPPAVPSSERDIPRAPSLPPLPPNKPVVKPNKKMKQLFWTVIKPVNVYQTIWMDLEEVPVPWENSFDSLFSATQQVKKISAGGAGGGGDRKQSQKHVVTLFDGKRTQNVAIACGKLRKSPEELYELVLMLEPEELTGEMNDTIMNLLLPTTEEIGLVRSYLVSNMKLYDNARYSSSQTSVPVAVAAVAVSVGATSASVPAAEVSSAASDETVARDNLTEGLSVTAEGARETEQNPQEGETTTPGQEEEAPVVEMTNGGFDELEEERLRREAELNLINDLDYSGKLFAYFMNIPRLESRLRCHQIILTWNEEANVVTEQLQLVQEALSELTAPHSLSSFKLIFSTLLTIGNYMNGLTKRGQAHGYRLEILLKLKLIKQNEATRRHLLHFLITYIEEYLPSTSAAASGGDTSAEGATRKVEPFYSNWKAVWLMNKINMKNLETLFKEIKGSVDICRTEIELAEEIPDDQIREPLIEKLGMSLSLYPHSAHLLVSTLHSVSLSL
jgi:hypothetical protein